MTGVFGGGGIQTVQTQNMVDLTLSGNTSGTLALVSSGTLTLAGGNNVTLSQVGNAVTISGASISQSVQTQNLIDITLGGNTSGTLALMSSGTVTVAGGNNITLSQVGNAVTISAGAGGAAPALSMWANAYRSGIFSETLSADIFYLVPLNPAPGNVFPGNMTVNTAFMNISGNFPPALSSGAITFRYGIYTINGSTLSLHNSVSTFMFLSTDAANSSMVRGPRFMSIDASLWSASPTFSNTAYYLGYISHTSNRDLSLSYIGWFNLVSGLRSGILNVGQGAGNTSQGWEPFIGVSTDTIANTSPLPVSVQVSELRKSGADYYFIPHLVFMNLSGQF